MAELPEEVRIFLLESQENIDKVEQNLLALEKSPGSADLINGVFRAVHTIKGNSGFLAFPHLETLCHKGESILDKARNGKIKLVPEIISLLLELVDAVRTILGDIEASGKESARTYPQLIQKMLAYV